MLRAMHRLMKNSTKFFTVLSVTLLLLVAFLTYQRQSSDSQVDQEARNAAMQARRVKSYSNLETCIAALKKDPNDAAGYRGLAEYYARQKDKPKSIENWKKATEVESGNDYNWLRLGIALRNTRQFAEAAEAFRQIENHDTKDAPPAKRMLKKMRSLGEIP